MTNCDYIYIPWDKQWEQFKVDSSEGSEDLIGLNTLFCDSFVIASYDNTNMDVLSSSLKLVRNIWGFFPFFYVFSSSLF